MLLLVTPESGTSELDLLPKIFDAGLERLHIRKPTMSYADLKSYLDRVPSKYRSRCVLHQFLDLVSEYGCVSGHLKESLRDTTRAPAQVGSTSAHTRETLGTLDGYQYVFFSPVFKSISKTDYLPRYSEQELREIVRTSHVELCALGGIQERNITKVKELGFPHAALCGAVWQAEDPLHAWKNVKELWQ